MADFLDVRGTEEDGEGKCVECNVGQLMDITHRTEEKDCVWTHVARNSTLERTKAGGGGGSGGCHSFSGFLEFRKEKFHCDAETFNSCLYLAEIFMCELFLCVV